jgi:hypothetical protein
MACRYDQSIDISKTLGLRIEDNFHGKENTRKSSRIFRVERFVIIKEEEEGPG